MFLAAWYILVVGIYLNKTTYQMYNSNQLSKDVWIPIASAYTFYQQSVSFTENGSNCTEEKALSTKLSMLFKQSFIFFIGMLYYILSIYIQRSTFII